MTKRQIKIELFRLRLHNGIFVPQSSLGRGKMLFDCVEAGLRFTRGGRLGSGVWLTGEVQKLDKDQVCFQFGKISPEEREYYDEDDKKFLRKPVEKVNHTLIYMDVNHQLVGIIPNSKVDQKTVTIADNLGRAMSSNLKEGVIVTLGPIGDPTEFVKQLLDAYAVKYFSIAYALPNHNLSTDGLYKALSEWTEDFGAEQSTIGIKAKDDIKNRKLMVDCAENANMAGYSTTAKIQEEENSGLKTVKLGISRAIIWIREKIKNEHTVIMSEIVAHYKKIAKKSSDDSSNSNGSET